LIALSHSDREGFQKQFDDIGLPIIHQESFPKDEYEFLFLEFNLLWGIRNVLQHNHGIINEMFLRKVQGSGYRVGDRVTIDITRLGRAFAATESIADDLNRRSVAKYCLP